MGTFCKVCSLFRYLFSYTRVNTVNRQQSRIWLHCDNFLLRPHSLIFFMDMVSFFILLWMFFTWTDWPISYLSFVQTILFMHSSPTFHQKNVIQLQAGLFWLAEQFLIRIVFTESLWFIEYDCCHRLWSWISKVYLGSMWRDMHSCSHEAMELLLIVLLLMTRLSLAETPQPSFPPHFDSYTRGR